MTTSIVWTNRDSVLAALGRAPKVFEQEIVAGLEIMAQKLVGKTSDLAPAGSGANGSLHASIVAERPQPTGKGWRVEYGSPLEHAEVIEYGRTPGSRIPPIEDIARWVWTKLDPEDEDDAQNIAYKVARSIARKGFTTGPVPGKNGGTAWAMFSRAQKEMADEIGREGERIRERIERRLNEGLN